MNEQSFCSVHEQRLLKLEDKFDALMKAISEVQVSNHVLASKLEDIKQLRDDVSKLKELKNGIVMAASIIASIVSTGFSWVVKMHL